MPVQKIPPALEDTLALLRQMSSQSADLLIHRVVIGGIPCALLGCEGMLSSAVLTEAVLSPLNALPPAENADALLSQIRERVLIALDAPAVYDAASAFRLLHSGFVLLAADGASELLAFGMQGKAARSISEPSGEASILGAHEGFTEVIRTNMAMLRSRMKTPLLTFEMRRAGSLSQTDICLCWLSDRTDPRLLTHIRQALDAADPETVLTPGYLQPYLEQGSGLFDSVGMTERPDVLASRLLEGRVGIFIDGVPFVLTAPRLFVESFQSVDDYAFKPWYAAFIRYVKYAAFFLTLLLPALYVAVSMHHPELLNRTLLLILTQAEADEPLSLPLEAAGVLLMYEMIREAGLRLPKTVGGAVGIVGGIIIGDAAVAAGLVSTPMLTVTAIAVTAGFILPDLAPAISVLRLLFLAAGGLWGLTGIALLGVAVLWELCAAGSFGYPVTAPLSPFHLRGMRDVLTRLDFRRMARGGFTVEEYYDAHQ
ncbi:MAG: spore germination protein [Oscillospiraceae bacterium]|nr:spore germination protein [Oscillospiraceae bacterium]